MHSVVLLHEASHAPALADALEQVGYRVLARLEAATALHATLARAEPDVVVVASDTPAETTLAVLRALADAHPRPVVMFARDASRAAIRRAVECGVAAYVVDGWAQPRLAAIIEAAIARFETYQALRNELASTRTQLADRKLIEKAKGMVMEQRGVSEDAAYRALRKMAMDQNLALSEVARRVIALSQLFT